jgi:gliding motility-associated-like protein
MLFNSRKRYAIIWAKLLVSISLCFCATFSNAQKEAAVWSVGAGLQLNFKSGNLEFSTSPANYEANTTICDKEGNLVLYTNGRTVWNRNNEIIVNGDGLIPANAYQNKLPVFVPYPKKDGWYILIYEEDYGDIRDNTLYYAEIDANANGGKGEVVRKKVKIHDNFHSSPIIAGFCENSYYWLAIERNENTIMDIKRDRIYFYKIDENGVNLTPKIDGQLNIGNSAGYRFSPNGDKFYFRFGGNQVEMEVVADFNFIKGEMYNVRNIGFTVNFNKEFSPNSRLLYFFSNNKLIQVDVGYSTTSSIVNSAVTILTLESTTDIVYPGGDLRLAPDGKIYFSYYDVIDRKTKLGVINAPNKRGFACDAETDIYTITGNTFRMPEFVTSFLRDKHPEMQQEVFANAGPDVEVCSNSIANLGLNEDTNAFYTWMQETEFDNPFSAKTVYRPSRKHYSVPETATLTLRATDGNCWLNFDEVNVMVMPAPEKLPVEGSWSVCPFVEEVDYWTVGDGNTLHWLVSGGEIVSDPTNDSIKINWGVTNKDASVSLFSTNHYGCNSDTTVFSVRINVELITETPKGASQLCVAECKNISYQIRNTNGSVYMWIAEKGEVVTGQGTNKVVVDWHGDGMHKLIVEESSTTIDTICFGASEPLIVNVLNDSLEIKLEQVSYIQDNKLAIQYSSEKLRNEHSLFLLIQNERKETLKELFISGSPDGKYVYIPDNSELSSELISLKVINSCNETFYSNQQQTIVLKGIAFEKENRIRLSWNINQFWENDKLEHEIWYSETGLDDWKIIAEGESGTAYDFQLKGLSLSHYFRIKEINRDKNLESWSNTIKIEVEGDITIPDVFTPNGDGINDEWQISNIRFRPFQKIIIYNRFGQVIYECSNEFIPWDGKINGEIIQGTYFYQIIFDQVNKKYGQVTVLK